MVAPLRRTAMALAMIAGMLANRVNGFSLQTTSAIKTPTHAQAPMVAPTLAVVAPKQGSRFPLPTASASSTMLPMSSIVNDDSSTNGVTTSNTKLQASNLEEGAMTPLTKGEKTTFPKPQQLIFNGNVNDLINYSLFTIAGAFLIYKLILVDGGMARGWYPEEIITRGVGNVWSTYMHTLQEHPIATKAVTSGTVYTIGDVIAQRTESEGEKELDLPRVTRSMLAGLIGHGPMSHVWYQVSEHFFDNILHLTQWWSFIPKVIVDQGFWGPIWNNSYIILLGLMKLESPDTIWKDMKRTTIPLVLSGLKLWPLAHCVTYGLIPVENRLLWVDMVEILWVTILASQAAGHAGSEMEKKTTEAPPLPVVAVEQKP